MRRHAFIALLLLSVCICASGQTPAQKDRKARLEKEIAALNSRLKETSGKSANAQNRLKLVNRKVASRKALVDESDARLRSLDDSISRKQAEMDRLGASLDTLTLYYGRLVRSAYRNRDPRLWYMYILAGENVNQVTHRYAYLKNLSSRMNAQALEIKRMRQELQMQKDEVEGLRATALEVRNGRAEELDRLRGDQAEAEKLVDRLNRDKRKYQDEIAAKRRQVISLNKEIERIIGAASKQSAKTSTKVDTKLSADFAANKGKLPWPAEGVVVDQFGEHYHPVYKNVKLPFNNGVNIAVSKGTKVKCVFSGVVKQVIVMPGYNKCVLVQHGGYFTFYCKLQSVSVKAGDKVSTGQTVGVVDTIGDETEVHFQLWEGRAPQDPEAWLR